MIHITDEIAIDESEVELKFVRSGGPGGQHVNKVATAVQLRFDAAASDALRAEIVTRMRRIGGPRISPEGVVLIHASRYRSQKKNRDDAVARLVELIRDAIPQPKKRRATRPSNASKQARLEDKKRRASVKRSRGAVKPED